MEQKVLAITFLYLRELNFFCEMEFLLKYVLSFSPAPAAEMETYKYPAVEMGQLIFFLYSYVTFSLHYVYIYCLRIRPIYLNVVSGLVSLFFKCNQLEKLEAAKAA